MRVKLFITKREHQKSMFLSFNLFVLKWFRLQLVRLSQRLTVQARDGVSRAFGIVRHYKINILTKYILYAHSIFKINVKTRTKIEHERKFLLENIFKSYPL